MWEEIRNQVLNLAPGNYVEQFSGGTSQFISQTPTPHQFPDYITIPVDAAFESLQNWSGFNTSLVPQNDGDDGLAVKMAEQSPAQIYRQVTIPKEASYMQFKLLVQAVGTGDELLVSFGNTLLFDQPLVGTQTEFSLTQPIFVGDLAGLTDQFVVTLQSDGNPGTTIHISDLKFLNASVVPEPASLLMLLAMWFAMLLQRDFRCGYHYLPLHAAGN